MHKQTELNAGWPIAPANAQHIGKRDSQQDAFGFSDFSDAAFAEHGGYVAVLADGMGGLQNGAWSSVNAVRKFLDTYKTKTIEEPIQATLARAVRAANAQVYNEAARLNLLTRMGTTLVAGVILKRELHWISVGDSRAYLYEAGKLSCLTKDHSYSEVLRQKVSAGEITLTEAENHPLRHSLTSHLGRPEPLAIDASETPRRISEGAWLLLCSDGLSGVLSEADMSRQLYGTPHEACDRLVHAALDRGLPNQDNTTVAILQLPAAGQRVISAFAKTQATYPKGTDKKQSPLLMWSLAALAISAAIGIGALASGIYRDDNSASGFNASDDIRQEVKILNPAAPGQGATEGSAAMLGIAAPGFHNEAKVPAPKPDNQKPAVPKQTTQKEPSTKTLAAKPTAVKDAKPKEVAPKEATSKEVAPKEATPKEVVSKEVVSKEAVSKEASPKEVVPKEATPKEVAPKI